MIRAAVIEVEGVPELTLEADRPAAKLPEGPSELAGGVGKPLWPEYDEGDDEHDEQVDRIQPRRHDRRV